MVSCLPGSEALLGRGRLGSGVCRAWKALPQSAWALLTKGCSPAPTMDSSGCTGRAGQRSCFITSMLDMRLLLWDCPTSPLSLTLLLGKCPLQGWHSQAFPDSPSAGALNIRQAMLLASSQWATWDEPHQIPGQEKESWWKVSWILCVHSLRHMRAASTQGRALIASTHCSLDQDALTC